MLDAARRRAAETAARLKRAPRAQYPGQPAAPQAQQSPMAGHAAPFAASHAAKRTAEQPAAVGQGAGAAASAAGAEAARQGAYRAHVQGQAGEQATPGIDAVLAVNKRASDRATAYAADNTKMMAEQAKRRERLRGDLMASAFKLANPGASDLELDMARRRR